MKLSNDPHAIKVTVGLALAGILLFGASFNDPFHFDDTLITGDSNVTNPARWSHFFNPLYLRQFTFFSFYLNHLVGGVDPAGYHLVNVALHIANAVLLFFLLGRFFERWIAIAAAAVFLVHPIQTEPVLYVYQRSILLACFFSLLGLIALVERRHWLAVLFFFLAFEGKESAIAVPLAVAVLVGTVNNLQVTPHSPPYEGGVAAPSRKRARSEMARPGWSLTSYVADCVLKHGARATTPSAPLRWLRSVFLVAQPPLLHKEGNTRGEFIDRRYRIALLAGAILLAVAALGLLVYWNEQTVGVGVADQISPVRYFLVETRVIYTYLRLLFFPYPQSLEYEFPMPGGILHIAGLLAIFGAAWWIFRHERWRVPGLSILAFFILLAPTSSIIPSTDAAFEHRLYLPMLAFSLLAAWLLSRAPRRTWIAVALLLLLSVLTVRRGTVWSSEIALWEDTVKRAPGKARVWFNLGGAYLNTDPGKARPAFLRALDLQPDFVEAAYDLGVIEQRQQNWSRALAYYERTIEKNPEYWPAWNNMGNTLFAMGQRERALQYFEKTLSLNRDYWPAQYNMAIVHFMSGRYADAVPRLKTVLDWRPDFREARQLFALSIARTGNRRAADEEMKKLGELTAAESRTTPTMILAPNRP
ncbi:MAG TPA: tetratricopeptide repeat protein [Terriglobia bacterium]|nr:tetratricopeptide repeat protein [Terriglobia bacterium]